MLRRICSFITGFILIISFFQPGAPLVQASSAPAPGFYSGWVSILARHDIKTSVDSNGGHSDYNNKIVVRTGGQIMILMDGKGPKDGAVLLPTDVALDQISHTKAPTGAHCTMASTVYAKSYFIYYHLAPASLAAFQIPFTPQTRFYYTLSDHAQLGDIPNCEAVSAAQLPGNRLTVKDDLGMITAIQFQTTYQSDTEMGGTCSLPGWIQSGPFSSIGTYVYTLPQCSWRVFKAGQPTPQKGWK